MKTKTIAAVLLILIAIPFSAFCVNKSAQSDNKSKIVVTGYVVSKGSMPFTEPAIKADDGTEYTIICTQKQRRRLLNLQGKHLRLTLIRKDELTWVVKKFKTIQRPDIPGLL